MDTENVIRTAVAAYNAGDAAAVSDLIHADIRYCIHGRPDTGCYCKAVQGREAFWALVGRIQADWSIDSYRLADLIISGNRAASQIDMEITSRHTGAQHRSELALFWTIQDGKITDLQEYHDTALLGTSRG